MASFLLVAGQEPPANLAEIPISQDASLRLRFRLDSSGTLKDVLLPELQASRPSICPTLFRQALCQLNGFPLPQAEHPDQDRFRLALLSIPPGQTRTYGALAHELGSSPRGIGARCASNPLLLRIPCHRVISKGSLGGYRGGVSWKQWLLEFEQT